MAQKELMKILKVYLEISMHILDDNNKIVAIQTIYVFRTNSLLRFEQSGIL